MKRILFLLCFVSSISNFSAQNTFMGNTGTTGVENGYEWVDLGLPSGLKWATCNVGAEKPKDYGWFFLWGEVEPRTIANKDQPYKFLFPDSISNRGLTKYTIPDGNVSSIWYDSEGNFIGDNKTVLDKEDDAVTVNMGGRWRMPTAEEYVELIEYCKFEGKGWKGVKVLGPNGNSIFFPYYMKDSKSLSYMSSTLSDEDSSKIFYFYVYGYKRPVIVYIEKEGALYSDLFYPDKGNRRFFRHVRGVLD